MATSKTFRVSFKNGALHITRGGRLIGKACRGETARVEIDLGLRPGEYILERSSFNRIHDRKLCIELVQHQRGSGFLSYVRADVVNKLAPVIRMSVKIAADLNVVSGVWKVRRLDRRTCRDWNRPRA